MMFVDGGWLYPATTARGFGFLDCRSVRAFLSVVASVSVSRCLHIDWQLYGFWLVCIRISLVCVCM